MQKALQDIRNHLREDIQKVDEPQLKAMFETSAEVLGVSKRRSRTTNRRTKRPGADLGGAIAPSRHGSCHMETIIISKRRLLVIGGAAATVAAPPVLTRPALAEEKGVGKRLKEMVTG